MISRSALIKPLAIALAVSLLSNIGGAFWIHALRADARAANMELTAAADANAGNVQVIHAQSAALDACVGSNQMIERLAIQADADFEAAKAERAKAAALAVAARKAIYANDSSCAAWGDAPVCRAISDSL